MAEGPPVTLDLKRLGDFVDELLAAGFRAVGTDGRIFVGPVPYSLGKFTGADEMTIVVADAWPYRQPQVIVPGIEWWHAAHDMPCLWQAGDNTKRWMTLGGLLDRINEWVEHARTGFTSTDGAALDPQLYFDSYTPVPVAVDVDDLIGGLTQDGQHGLIHLDFITDELTVIKSGKGSNALWGRWFYRTDISAPPKDIDSFERSLTDNQLTRLNKVVDVHGKGLFALAWPTVHGKACLMVIIDQTSGARKAFAVRPTPLAQADRLRRAGPDSTVLLTKRVVLFGAGAIGSHVGSILSRSGLGQLAVVDGDVKLPAGLVRHAGATVGIGKAAEMRDLLAPFDWTTVEVVPECPWDLDTLGELIAGADLCVDATGLSPFAEFLSRIAAEQRVPMITVALYRGGRVARIRRQGPEDHPIVYRTGHWRYPAIPAGNDRSADFVGAETGCTAPIHNAPPAAVTSAASLAALVAIDLLTDRMNHPDELIDVLEPIEAPFDRLGRHGPQPPTVMVTEPARRAMVAAAAESHPRETGGVLLGILYDTGAPCVTDAIEFRPQEPSTHRYQVPEGLTTATVDAARTRDERVGYLGEWHSHPTDQPASPIDGSTMANLAANPDTGEPALFVLRPTSHGQFTIEAYMSINSDLVQVPLVDIGPISSEEQP